MAEPVHNEASGLTAVEVKANMTSGGNSAFHNYKCVAGPSVRPPPVC